MIMGVERKWAPTMMKLDADRGGSSVVSEEPEDDNKEDEATSGNAGNSSFSATIPNPQGTQHFFLEILRTKHGVWHMWIWYLGEPDEAGAFRCEIAIRCEIIKNILHTYSIKSSNRNLSKYISVLISEGKINPRIPSLSTQGGCIVFAYLLTESYFLVAC